MYSIDSVGLASCLTGLFDGPHSSKQVLLDLVDSFVGTPIVPLQSS